MPPHVNCLLACTLCCTPYSWNACRNSKPPDRHRAAISSDNTVYCLISISAAPQSQHNCFRSAVFYSCGRCPSPVIKAVYISGRYGGGAHYRPSRNLPTFSCVVQIVGKSLCPNDVQIKVLSQHNDLSLKFHQVCWQRGDLFRHSLKCVLRELLSSTAR